MMQNHLPDEQAPEPAGDTLPDIPIVPVDLGLHSTVDIVDISIHAIDLAKIQAEEGDLPSPHRPSNRAAEAVIAPSQEPSPLVQEGDEAKPKPKKPKKIKYRPATIRQRFDHRHREGDKRRKQGKGSGDRLIRHFAACPRCSYFLSGYRVLYGKDVVKTLVDEVEDGWIPMPWTVETRNLLQRSYGIRTDVGFYYFEIACDSCCRRIVFEAKDANGAPDGENESRSPFVDEDYFWVEIKLKR